MSCQTCEAYRDILDAQEKVAHAIVRLAEALLVILDRNPFVDHDTFVLLRSSLVEIVDCGHELADVRPGPDTTVQ